MTSRMGRLHRRIGTGTAVAVVASVIGVIGLAPPASAKHDLVAPTRVITSAGPLNRIEISADLNCAVNHMSDPENGEFFDDTACATLIAIGGTLYGPHDIPAAPTFFMPRTPFSQVSQVSGGSGTSADPFTIVTVVTAGTTGVRLTQTDSYVVGQESYRTDVQVTNTGATNVSAVLYKAGDCFLQNSDKGFGAYDPVTGAISCVAGILDPTDPSGSTATRGTRVEQFLPLTAGSSYLEARFDEVWSAVGTQQALPNQCARCDTFIDNGIALSWTLNLAPGASTTVSHLTTFSPQGVVPLTTAKTADIPASNPGTANGYTITVTNSNVSEAVLNSITDTLPPGFTYTSGSSTGATTSEPTVNGQELTWSGPMTVAANGSVSLHFAVAVSSRPGQYFNEATASSALTVAPTGPTAEVIVVPPPEQSQYVLVAKDGGIFTPGGKGFYGTASVRPGDGILRDSQGRIIGASGAPLDSAVVAFAYTPTRQGYWLVQANGGVIPIGDAPDIGNLKGVNLKSPIVGAAATENGAGLYLAAGDGGIFALGEAPFKGSLGGVPLNKPIVGMDVDADGSGYFLVASDGGIFAFDALFRGSLGALPLNRPIVDMAVHDDGSYVLAASDGGVFAFGADFHGSLGGISLIAPIVGIAADPDGSGYWMAGADGGAFAFGATFYGSLNPVLLNSPMSGIAAL